MSLHRVPIVLLVAAIHALLLGLLWQALHQPLPNRPSSKVARTDRSQSIVFLLEPYAPAATKPRRNEPRLEDRSMPADRTHAIAAPEPVYGSEVSNAAALSSAPAAVEAASAPVRMEQALRLDAKTMQRAIADAQRGTFREMAKNAGRLDEIEPLKADQFAGVIASAALPSLLEQSEARLAAFKKESCRPKSKPTGGQAIGGAPPPLDPSMTPNDSPLAVANLNDCKK